MLCRLVTSVEISLFIAIFIQCRLSIIIIMKIELPALIVLLTTHRDDFIEGVIAII